MEDQRARSLPSGWEFMTFPAKMLEDIKGEFAGSEFVKQTTGVDNVCERSAVHDSGGGTVIIKKQAGDGITIAYFRLIRESSESDGCIL